MTSPQLRAEREETTVLVQSTGSTRTFPWKRLVDLLLASVLLVAALPVIAAAALLILAIDRQKPFFPDARVGLRGSRFSCFKLRTMRDDEHSLEAYFVLHPTERAAYSLCRKLNHDPRITRLGRFLRATSLDELPQLLNVLMGQMSLVGPRPLSPPEFQLRGPGRFLVASVRPGLTGLWQVSGRSDLDPASRVLLDNYYARNQSLRLDLEIIIRTPVAIVRRRGAR